MRSPSRSCSRRRWTSGRLDQVLDLYAAGEARARTAAALTGLGVGAVLLPTGLILYGRTDGISRALVIGSIIGGTAQLLSVPFLFIPSRMADIRAHLHGWISAKQEPGRHGAVDRGGVARGGDRRATQAPARRDDPARIGVLSLATGVTFLLANEGLFGMGRSGQYTLGGVLMGIGIPVTTLGTKFLIDWSAEETAWEAYRTMKPEVTSAAPSIAIVPTTGGGLAIATWWW